MKMNFGRKYCRPVAFSLILILICGLLAACGDKPNHRDSQHTTPTPTKEATPTSAPTNSPEPSAEPLPTDSPLPTEEPSPVVTEVPGPEPTNTVTPLPTNSPTPSPTPTETPTPTPTPTPTSTPTPSPSPTPVVYKAEDLWGTWYSLTVSSGEMDETESVEGTDTDYRLRISFDDDEKNASGYLTQMTTYTDDDGEQFGPEMRCTLKYSFTDEELEMYRSWNYGVIDYAMNPTDLAKGHLVFASWFSDLDFPDGTRIVADMQPDGTMKAELICVLDNGSFPIFVSFTFARPQPARGGFYGDYLGIWYARTHAAYYEDAFDEVDPWPNDFIVFYDNSMTYYSVQREDGKTIVVPIHCEERVSFTEAELAEFKKWDEAGIYVWGEKYEGEALTFVNDYEEGWIDYLYMTEDGDLIAIEWRTNPDDYLGLTWISYSEEDDCEYMTYYSFRREFPRDEEMPNGSYFSDYVGHWYLQRYQNDSSDTIHPVQLDSEGIFLSIDGEMNAICYPADGKPSKFSPLMKNDSVPSWYKDAGVSGKYTDYKAQTLVLRCTDETDPDSLLILKMQADGSISGTRISMINGEIKTVPFLEFTLNKGRLRRK